MSIRNTLTNTFLIKQIGQITTTMSSNVTQIQNLISEKNNLIDQMQALAVEPDETFVIEDYITSFDTLTNSFNLNKQKYIIARNNFKKLSVHITTLMANSTSAQKPLFVNNSTIQASYNSTINAYVSRDNIWTSNYNLAKMIVDVPP